MSAPRSADEQLPLQPQHYLREPRLQLGGRTRAERGDRLVNVAAGADQFVAVGHRETVNEPYGPDSSTRSLGRSASFTQDESWPPGTRVTSRLIRPSRRGAFAIE